MPLTLSNATKRTKTIDIDYDGETVAVTFYPRAMTHSLIKSMQASDTDNISGITDALTHLVASWDVLDDAGNQLPPTVEVMQGFPVDFMGAVFTGIVQAMQPGEANGTT